MTGPEGLEHLRREIDELDERLFSIFARRMAVVREIGRLKHQGGLPPGDPVREAQLKARLKELTDGVLEPHHVEELAATVLRISRELQAVGADGSP